MLKGTRNALNDQSSVLIAESTAKAYFGDADPMAKILKIDNQIEAVKVAGVYEDLPKNSYLFRYIAFHCSLGLVRYY